MPANNQFLPVDKLDFFQAKENLKTFLKQQQIFKDYDFDGPNISTLLDILAYNTHNLAFYLNMVGNEAFLDSALIRDSVTSRASELNYIPRSYTSSHAVVRLKIVASNSNPSVTVPRGFRFYGQKDQKNYVFATNESFVVRKNANGDFISADIPIFEGLPVTEYFIVNNAVSDQRYIISNSRVDLDSLQVNVRASNVDTSNSDYTYASSLYGINGNSLVYFLQSAGKNRYELIFGDSVFGMKVNNGNVIRLDYRVASGNVADSIASFSAANTVSGFQVSTTTVSQATGGTEFEDIATIKLRAPRFYQAQERAVSAEDYRQLIIDNFSEINDVGVYGGEEITETPEFGRVYISPTTFSGFPVTDRRKSDIEAFLRERMPISLRPMIINPETMHIIAKIAVKYDVSETSKSSVDIDNAVMQAITTFNDTFLETFASSFRYSKFIRAIDDADSAIVSNDTSIVMMKFVIPKLNITQSYTIKFGNTLETGGDIEDDKTLHVPVVYSSEFTYQNRTAYIQDDGFGTLFIYEPTATGDNVLNAAVGLVNYETGTITISNLVVNDYVGEGIAIYAKPEAKDVDKSFNTVIRMDNYRADISVIGV